MSLPAEVEAAIQRLPGGARRRRGGRGRYARGRGGPCFCVEMTAGLTLDIDALNTHPGQLPGALQAPAARIEQLDALPLTLGQGALGGAARAQAGAKRRSPASGCVGFAGCGTQEKPNHPVKNGDGYPAHQEVQRQGASVETSHFPGYLRPCRRRGKLCCCRRCVPPPAGVAVLVGAVPPAGRIVQLTGRGGLVQRVFQRATTTVATALPIRLVSARASDIKAVDAQNQRPGRPPGWWARWPGWRPG